MKKSFFSILVLIALSAFSFAQTLPEKNQLIIDFCNKNMGKKIDRGECWDLAKYALESAGAKWTPPLIYGKKVAEGNENYLPGDIMQLENVTIQTPEKATFTFPKHTAVIYEVGKDGELTLAHQNVDGQRFVVLSKINFKYKKKGKFTVYRPQ